VLKIPLCTHLSRHNTTSAVPHLTGLYRESSCSDPIPVEPSSSLTLNPCDTGDSTGRPESDAVMLLGPQDTTKEITVEASGIDTVLSIFTSCPASSFGPSQVSHAMEL